MSSNSKKKESLDTSRHFDLDSNTSHKVFHDPRYIPNINETKINDKELKLQIRNKKQKQKRMNQRRKTYIESRQEKKQISSKKLTREELKIQRQLFLMEAPAPKQLPQNDCSYQHDTGRESSQKKSIQMRQRSTREKLVVNEEFDMGECQSVLEYLKSIRAGHHEAISTTSSYCIQSNIISREMTMNQNDIQDINICFKKFKIKQIPDKNPNPINQSNCDLQIHDSCSINDQTSAHIKNSNEDNSKACQKNPSNESILESLKQLSNKENQLLKKRDFEELIGSPERYPDRSSPIRVQSISKYIFGENIVGYDLVKHLRSLDLISEANN